jgi:Leu/Phe-tRNA-protein transferase
MKEGKKLKRTTNMGFIINQVVQTVIDKCAKIQFVATWALATMKEMGDKFHKIFG